MSTFLKMQKQIENMRTKNFMYLYLYKSNKNLYCQVIDPYSGHVILSYSTLDKEMQTAEKLYGNTVHSAGVLANFFASKLRQAGFTHLKIWKTDKNLKGFYHGRIKAFVDGLRSTGIMVD
jgi:ribosomal protein L18